MTMVLLFMKYTGEINSPLWVALIPLFIDIALFFLFLVLALERYRKQNAELIGKLAFSENYLNNARAKIEKMKCCENCKYNSYWGNELHCNYGMKEALSEDKLVECNNFNKWELKEVEDEI